MAKKKKATPKGKGNRYVAEAKKASILGQMQALPTKGNVKYTLLETGKDLLIGVVGGGLAGAAIGKPSLLIGLGITGAGHYFDNRLATILGIGMMAANGFQQKSVSGLEGLEGIKERIQSYKDSFSEKLYIDKLVKKAAPAATNGIGELQYFNYQQEVSGNDDLSGGMAALDSIERQIEESGMRRMQMEGAYELEGAYDNDVSGLADVTDLNM
ncbi:MAG: hypothetical protein JST82_11230 [Bacteroidetes bacterium]|nr:hypothetical protein [Bacteroidota bacterium]